MQPCLRGLLQSGVGEMTPSVCSAQLPSPWPSPHSAGRGKSSGRGPNSDRDSAQRFAFMSEPIVGTPPSNLPRLHSGWRRGPGRGGAAVSSRSPAIRRRRDDTVSLLRSAPLTLALSPLRGAREVVGERRRSTVTVARLPPGWVSWEFDGEIAGNSVAGNCVNRSVPV